MNRPCICNSPYSNTDINITQKNAVSSYWRGLRAFSWWRVFDDPKTGEKRSEKEGDNIVLFYWYIYGDNNKKIS